MNPFLWVAVIVALLPSAPSPETRKAVYYSPGTMAHVIEVRLRQGLITPADVDRAQGFYAMPSCSDIGKMRVVSLWDSVSGAWTKPARMLQVDCSQPRDRKRHEAEGLIEVGYELAVQAHFVGEGKTAAHVWEVEER